MRNSVKSSQRVSAHVLSSVVLGAIWPPHDNQRSNEVLSYALGQSDRKLFQPIRMQDFTQNHVIVI